MSIQRRLVAFLLSCFFIFVPAVVYSQSAASASSTDDSWYYGAIIKSVTFKGLKNVSSKDVEGVLSGYKP